MRVLWCLQTEKEDGFTLLIEDKYWSELEIIPRVKEWVQVDELVSEEDYNRLLESARCWSGGFGEVGFVNLRKDSKGFYYEISIDCDD